MINIAPSEIPWLERFFSGENYLAWAEIASETAPIDKLSQVLPWLRFCQKTPLDRPVVLPVYAKDGVSRWYGVADNPQIAAQMAQDVQGFIGPSYSNFEGHMHALSPSDPVEAVLRERFGPFAVRFEPISPGEHKEIERLLLLYQGVLSRRPPIVNRGQRPFGQIRSDFDRALLAGNVTGAERFLDEMLASGRVSAEQSRFLRIRYLAGLGRHEELARDHTLIVSVIELPLPPQTLADLIEALHTTYIADAEKSLNVELIQKEFRQHVARSYGPLFRERKGIRRPEVLRMFLLFESILEPPGLTRCEALLHAYPKDIESRLLAEKILEAVHRVIPSAPADYLSQAKQAIADEDYGLALDLCYKALPERWAYSALLRCALEMNSESARVRVLATVEDAKEEVRSALTQRDHERLKALRVRVQLAPADHDLSNWVGWAKWVNTAPQNASLASALEKAVVGWDVEDYVRDAGKQCQELALIIGNARGPAETAFRDAFPRLVEFFVERPNKPSRYFAPIYLILIKMIGWGSSASTDELQLTLSIAEALLATAPDTSVYKECVEDIGEIINVNSAPTNLDWALDISELLILFPSPDAEARLRVFMTAVDMVRAWGHRITPTQRSLLGMLSKDYHCPDLADSLPQPEVAQEITASIRGFSGLVGIYTLSDGSARRAKDALEMQFPDASIEVNADTVATDRLKHLARNADIFVFAWKKSSHQAYYCAKEARGDRDLAMSSGGGAASLVQAVVSKVTALTSASATPAIA